jgi:hypothetical protein
MTCCLQIVFMIGQDAAFRSDQPQETFSKFVLGVSPQELYFGRLPHREGFTATAGQHDVDVYHDLNFKK